MKVFYRRNSVYAKAESLQDIQQLLNMKGASIARSSIDIPAVKPAQSGWAIRQKQPCMDCGGRQFKNLKLHRRMKHS